LAEVKAQQKHVRYAMTQVLQLTIVQKLQTIADTQVELKNGNLTIQTISGEHVR
jgi:hypothetical protein